MLNIEHIAKLAKLSLTDSEKKKMFSELASILDYVSRLPKEKENELKDRTKDRIGKREVVLPNIVRDDKAIKNLPEMNDSILKLAPARQKRYIKVKSVF